MERRAGPGDKSGETGQDCSAALLIIVITEHKASAPPSLRLYSPPQMAFVKQVQPN